MRILQETASTGTGYDFAQSRDGRVVNNLVVFERGTVSTDVNIGGDTDPGSFVFENNWFYATDDPGSSAPTLPGTESGTVAGTDPLLRADGTLDPSSGAIGAGLSGVDDVGDRLGACWADPPSVGSHEGS